MKVVDVDSIHMSAYMRGFWNLSICLQMMGTFE